MSRFLLLLFLTFAFSSNLTACRGGAAKDGAPAASGKTATRVEPVVACGDSLMLFLKQNGQALKGWPFKDWGYRKEKGQRVRIDIGGIPLRGRVLREFIELDIINGYSVISRLTQDSREVWLDKFEKGCDEYKYCGSLHLSDSFDTYVFTVEGDDLFDPHDAIALFVKDGKVLDKLYLASTGGGLGSSIKTNRIAENTFVQSRFSLDLIDEDGNPIGGYTRLQVSDNGKVHTQECPGEFFHKPTWLEK